MCIRDRKKLARFQEHAVFLKRQYTDNLGCHLAVAKARKAVGLDTVRALRVQSWLRTESINALEEESGDARRAFNALVEELLAEAGTAGTMIEKVAVRYFLADELTRCNVFPNEEDSFSEPPKETSS